MPPGLCIIVLQTYLHTPTHFNTPVIFTRIFLVLFFCLLSTHFIALVYWQLLKKWFLNALGLSFWKWSFDGLKWQWAIHLERKIWGKHSALWVCGGRAGSANIIKPRKSNRTCMLSTTAGLQYSVMDTNQIYAETCVSQCLAPRKNSQTRCSPVVWSAWVHTGHNQGDGHWSLFCTAAEVPQ